MEFIIRVKTNTSNVNHDLYLIHKQQINQTSSSNFTNRNTNKDSDDENETQQQPTILTVSGSVDLSNQNKSNKTLGSANVLEPISSSLNNDGLTSIISSSTVKLKQNNQHNLIKENIGSINYNINENSNDQIKCNVATSTKQDESKLNFLVRFNSLETCLFNLDDNLDNKKQSIATNNNLFSDKILTPHDRY